jgi:hypothetical protein
MVLVVEVLLSAVLQVLVEVQVLGLELVLME